MSCLTQLRAIEVLPYWGRLHGMQLQYVFQGGWLANL